MSVRDEILTALRKSGGDTRKAAEDLDWSLRTLQYRMREHRIPPAKRGPKKRPPHRRKHRRAAKWGLGLLAGLGLATGAALAYRKG